MAQKKSAVLGVDLGGTEVKFCLFDSLGTGLLQRWKCPTRDGHMADGLPEFAATIRSECHRLSTQSGYDLENICIAAPGLPGPGNLWVDYMPGRLHGLEKLNWTWLLERDFPVRVINDGQAALLGEIWKGGAVGARHAVQLTIGTGVGGAVFSDGRLLRGAIGRAGHIGHTSVDFQGVGDICGMPGSIEDAVGQVTLHQRSGGEFSAFSELAAGLAAGNPVAQKVWDLSIRALAASVAGIINIIDPEVVLIGGGLIETDLPVLSALGKWMDQFEWRPAGHRVRLEKSRLGQEAGAYGAAFAAINSQVLLD